VPTKDDDWIYHKPKPDEWEQTLNRWENKMENGSYTFEKGKGKMWRNDYATTERHPQWKGKVVLPDTAEPGKTMEIAIWYNKEYTNKDGNAVKECQSVNIQEVYKKEGESYGNQFDRPAPPPVEKDDIPF